MHLLIFLFLSSLLVSANKLNVIVILTDDQGYGDLGCYGSQTIKTPHIDQMAAEGKKFTSFYVASSICTPSRAALLTGSYAKRTGLPGGVLFPHSTVGLNSEEYTLADHFSANGYKTACVGKWHLGHHKEVLPTSNGFDYYFGIPYSNDMNHPKNEGKPQMGAQGMDKLWKDPESTVTVWNTPLMENEQIIEIPVDQRTITRRYTDKALEFIDESVQAEKPFFLYLPHSMPHIPIYVPDELRDADPKQAYRIVIEHIDAEVGRIMDRVRSKDLAKNTLVIYTSDNGPWLSYKHHGGSAKPLRDGKTTNFEGGQRVPCVMWAPGVIPAKSSSNEMLSTLDLLASLAALTKTDLPKELVHDSLDASEHIKGGGKSPRKEFIYYAKKLDAVGIRQGDWKLLKTGKKNAKVSLFNLSKDISETINLAKKHPEKVKNLTERLEKLDKEISDNSREAWIK